MQIHRSRFSEHIDRMQIHRMSNDLFASTYKVIDMRYIPTQTQPNYGEFGQSAKTTQSIIILMYLYLSLLPSCGFTDLVVKEEVDRGDEEALEGVEEVGREGPDGKGQPGSSQRVRPHEVQHVGDAQQRQQEEQTLERFPRKKD